MVKPYRWDLLGCDVLYQYSIEEDEDGTPIPEMYANRIKEMLERVHKVLDEAALLDDEIFRWCAKEYNW
jgi:hypothetical protein